VKTSNFTYSSLDVCGHHVLCISHFLKNGVFWDIKQCGSGKNRRFEELSASFSRVTPFFIVTAVKTSNSHFLFARYIPSPTSPFWDELS
jgi:hypothetical protein